jgi:hypothetical protein
VFENKVLSRIPVPKKKKVVGDLRKLHNEELHNLNETLPNIIWVIKSRLMRWVGHVIRMSETRNSYKILSENLKGRGTFRKTQV